MNKVQFSFNISSQVISLENESMPLSELNSEELKGFANGQLYIFFLPEREFIALQTGIYDYLTQIKNVIEEIDNGNSSPFSISCDWYSNNIEYLHCKDTNRLDIREKNDNEFQISTNYISFKKSFLKFYPQVIRDLLYFYPELRKNKFFK